jgi:hypothetical protein
MLADTTLTIGGGWGVVLAILLAAFLVLGIVWLIRHF